MIHPVQLKVELAGCGVRLDASGRAVAARLSSNGARYPVDLMLPERVRVSASVEEPSPFVLRAEGDRHVLLRHDASGAETLRVAVRVTAPPRFLTRRTRRGTPMERIASAHGNHLIVHPGSACGFSVRAAPCRFCVEGARVATDRDAAAIEEVVEVVRAAFEEGASEDVYFNTGFYDGEDGGIGFLAPYIEAVRKHFDTLIAVQVHPPRTNAWIDRTYAMGVDALSYNLEIFDIATLERQCIGRARYIGRERYLEALTHAARIFPSGTVWTDLVIGLEPPASTRAGIDALAAAGVVPVVSLVHEGRPAPPLDELAPVLAHLYRAVKERGIAMGWVRDLGVGITPLEARWFAGDGARLAVAVQSLTRSRLGGLAARSLSRFRRRLRVRRVQDSLDASHL